MSFGDSAKAALGRSIRESYLAAKRIGPGATVKQIQAATKDVRQHAAKLIQAERRKTLSAFRQRAGDVGRQIAKDTPAPPATLAKEIDLPGPDPHADDKESVGPATATKVARSGKPNSAPAAGTTAGERSPSSSGPQNRIKGTGPVGESAGAKKLDLGTDDHYKQLKVQDGIIMER